MKYEDKNFDIGTTVFVLEHDIDKYGLRPVLKIGKTKQCGRFIMTYVAAILTDGSHNITGVNICGYTGTLPADAILLEPKTSSKLMTFLKDKHENLSR